MRKVYLKCHGTSLEADGSLPSFLPSELTAFSFDAVMEYHGWLKHHKFVSYTSGGWEGQDQGAETDWCLVRAHFLVCTSLFILFILMWQIPCIVSYKDTDPIPETSTLKT